MATFKLISLVKITCPKCQSNAIRTSREKYQNKFNEIKYKCRKCREYFWGGRTLLTIKFPFIIFAVLILFFALRH